MNLNSLSDDELLRYLDKHSTDPLMLRVVDILLGKQHGIVSDLVEAGMDPQYWTFRPDSYNEFYPGQYVSHLEREVDSLEDEVKYAQYQLEEANKEIEQLKARTVAELIQELNQEITTEKHRASVAVKHRHEAEERERVALSKLKVWNILSTDTSQ